MSFAALLFWLVLTPQLLAPQLQEESAVYRVAVFKDESAKATSQAELRDPGVLSSVRGVWAWSASAAPVRYDPDRLPDGALPRDRERLRIRVLMNKNAPPPLASVWTIRAAPQAMWSEVPEPLLPSWRLPEGSEISVPRDPERAWRVRVIGVDHGSWWSDVRLGQSRVDMAPMPAESFVISVVDEDGSPLPEAAVELLDATLDRHPARRTLARYAVDSRGEAVLGSLPDAKPLLMMVSESSHASVAVEGRPSSLPTRWVLEKGATVSGVFEDPEGLPVGGVLVGATSFAAVDIPISVLRPTVTAADGSWQIGGLPLADVGLMARAAGFSPWVEQIELTSAAVDLGALTLRRAGRVRFHVVDDRDQPVVGARVILAPAGVQAVSDSLGWAEIEQALENAALSGRAEAEGHLPEDFRVPAPEADPVVVRLTRAFLVRGRFLGAGGLSVVDGKVRIEIGHRFNSEPVDPDGRFEVELPPQTAARLILSSPSTVELPVSIDEGASGETLDLRDLVVSNGLVLTGRVLAASDTAPVAGARVWALRYAAGRSLLSWINSDLVEAVTDVEGRFRLTGLANQPAEIKIEASGFARRSLDVTPSLDRGTLDLGEIELNEGATVRIVGDEGLGKGAVARVDLGNAWLDPDMLTAAVDSDGVAVLRNVAAGRATVSIVRGEELLCDQTVLVPEGPGLLEIECLLLGMRVTGVVEVGGYPAEAGLLSWRPPGPRAHAVVLANRAPGGLTQRRGLPGGRPDVRISVAAGGYFESDKLRSGIWEIVWSSGSGELSEPQVVVLPEIDQIDLVLSFPGQLIHGMVLSAEGVPVSGARVQGLIGGAFAFSAEDGTFSLAAEEAGLFDIQARFAELSSEILHVELVADRDPEPVRLVLEDRQRDRIIISVLESQGQPVGGALVFLEEESKAARILTADAQGRIESLIHPPRPSRIRVAATAGGLWALGQWHSLETAQKGLELRVTPGGSLKLKTDGEEDVVQIIAPGGWDFSWLQTRLGRRPIVAPGRPLLLEGLPVGTYEISSGSFRQSVSIESGETLERQIR